MIDTHCHLFRSYYEDLDNLIVKLKENNIYCIVNGCEYFSNIESVELSNNDNIYAAVGYQPTELDNIEDDYIEILEGMLDNNKVVAIGEIGLDYYWDKTYVNLQKEMFIKQIKISQEVNLPIIVHSRDAISDTYEIMKENPTKGVLHCFSSSLEMAREFVKLGYYIGIGGVVTFKNSKEIKRVVSGIDVKYLLTETDSPYLAPVPFRGTINKPSYIPLIIDEISKIKCMNKEIIEDIMYKNACSLFSLKD